MKVGITSRKRRSPRGSMLSSHLRSTLDTIEATRILHRQLYVAWSTDWLMKTIDFNSPNLASRAEQMSQDELDRLPFGVILLDRESSVVFYSKTEGRLSGYAPRSPLGQNFYDVAPSMDTDAFRGRITKAMEENGKVDLEIGWYGDYTATDRDLRIRVQSSRNGGVWIFIDRDEPQ
ncbi:MAG: PAS domain-containing protein [Rhizobiales bacterium]|nr:PAS domain-containing protein [Hyphomicrobiales bacterium]